MRVTALLARDAGMPGPWTSVRTSSPPVSRSTRAVTGEPRHGSATPPGVATTAMGPAIAEIETPPDLPPEHGHDAVRDGTQTWYGPSAHVDDSAVPWSGAWQATTSVAHPGATEVVSHHRSSGHEDVRRRPCDVSVLDDGIEFSPRHGSGPERTGRERQAGVETDSARITRSTREER